MLFNVTPFSILLLRSSLFPQGRLPILLAALFPTTTAVIGPALFSRRILEPSPRSPVPLLFPPLRGRRASAAAWVGINGWTCNAVILQTGVTFTVSSDGPKYDAWYEFYPGPARYFSGITISAGDVIRLGAMTSLSFSGTVTIENLTKHQTASETLASPVPLCGQTAEWIVEDYSQFGTGQVPFADFGTVTFTDAVTTGTESYTPSGAMIINLQLDNQVVTSVSTSGSSVTIKYV